MNFKENQINLRIEPETKKRLIEIAESERRSMTSLILHLIDTKIKEADNENEK